MSPAFDSTPGASVPREHSSPSRDPSAAERRTAPRVDPVSVFRTQPRVWIWIFGVALLLRLVCLFGQPLIGADASRFLAAAERVQNGELHEAVQDVYHPLTGYVFGCASWVQSQLRSEPATFRESQQRREAAALAVSLVAGLLTIVALVDLSRRLFPSVPATLVGWLAACQPYLVRASADIMSDSLYLLLFVSALWSAARAAEQKRWLTYAVTGGLIGFGYLTRPEALVLGPAVAVYWWIVAEAASRRRVLLGTAVAAAVSLLLVFPYVLIMYYDEGVWTLTRKKNLLELLGLGLHGLDSTPRYASFSRYQTAGVGAMFDLEAMWRVFTRWFFSCAEVYAGAAIIGAAAAVRGREWRRRHALFFVTGVLLVLVWLLLLHSEGNYRYLTKRHVFALVVLSIPLMGRGVLAFTRTVTPWLPAKWHARLYPGVLFLVLAVAGVKAAAPQRHDQLGQLHAADYILEHGGRGQVVFTEREKIVYYSGGVERLLHRAANDVLRSLRATERGWLAFYRDERPDLYELAQREVEAGRLEHAQSFSVEGGRPGRELELFLWRQR